MFYKPLCFYAARYIQDAQVAEEIVSDVMYRIWQNRHQDYQAETFREYLYTATRNTAINYMKQRKNQKNLTNTWAELFRGELIEETPLDAMIKEEWQLNLNRLLDSLPEQCRKVFLMSRIDDITYDKIAAEMDISPNTVKYHIKTALQKLRAGVGALMLCLIFFWSFLNFFYSPTYPISIFNCIINIVSYIP